jgi:hypothetical protein
VPSTPLDSAIASPFESAAILYRRLRDGRLGAGGDVPDGCELVENHKAVWAPPTFAVAFMALGSGDAHLYCWRSACLSHTLGDLDGFRPWFVPNLLVDQYVRRLFLAPEERQVVSEQIRSMYAGTSRTVTDPHPLVQLAATAVTMAEIAKVPMWATLTEAPARAVETIRILAEIQEWAIELEESRRKAAAMAANPHLRGHPHG